MHRHLVRNGHSQPTKDLPQYCSLAPGRTGSGGGPRPINTAYLSHINLEDFGLGPNAGRDPSFEIYTPPYAMRNDRPEILSAPEAATIGDTLSIQVDDAGKIDEVLLIRRTAMTHLIDGDQRAVELPIVSRNGRNLRLAMPDSLLDELGGLL